MTEERVRELADWVLPLLERLKIGAFKIDHSQGVMVDANKAMGQLFGASDETALIGKSVLGYFSDPKEREEAAARVYGDPQLKEKGYVRLEVQRTDIHGQPLQLLLSLAPQFDADGQVTDAYGLMEEIGERQAADKAFRSAEARFRSMFETSPVGMALVAPSGMVVRTNQALCTFLDCSEEDLRQRHMPDLVRAPYSEAAQQLLASLGDPAGEPGEEGAREWRFENANGVVKWGSVTYSWLREDDKPIALLLNVLDITGRKKIEEAMLRMEKLEAVGLLAGGIAHDYNNILTIILGNISLAQLQPDCGLETTETLDKARGGISRARDLTQQLITFARGGSPVTCACRVDLLAAEMTNLCLSGSNVLATIDICDSLRLADADPGQIRQVFQNLLINACEAMPGGGGATISISNSTVVSGQHPLLVAGEYVQVAVTDEGEGIESGRLSSIFDPYFSTRERGSGLGLTIVQSVLRRHGGAIDVCSEVGAGTTFTFYLPVAAAGLPEEAPQKKMPELLVEPGQHRLLLMDDDLAVQEVGRAALAHAGYQVDVASNGDEATAMYEQALNKASPYSLVILDLTVRGGFGGVEAMSRIRHLDPQALGVVASGYSSDPVMAQPHEYGFAGVVPKPFSFAALSGTVAKLLLEESQS